MTRPVVIILAFANTREGYLPQLADELRQIQQALKSTEHAGYCKVVSLHDATLEDICTAFRENRDRVAIFHFGGHSRENRLILSSGRGRAHTVPTDQLAAFLAEQKSLKLAFVNACFTQGGVQRLLHARIAAITTSEAIADRIAKRFATKFYQFLAAGVELGRAYREASSTLRAHLDDDPNYAYPELNTESRATRAWPWHLECLDEIRDDLENWTLQDAFQDPYWGLPPLPEGWTPSEPFRNLKSFMRNDASIFFGRGQEIRRLYRMIMDDSCPILLLHGASGIGKSSLLAAGLMPRLEAYCTVLYRRRDEGFRNLSEDLKEALGRPSDLRAAWSAKEQELPLIVILDQVELVWTQPNTEKNIEALDLISNLREIFEQSAGRPQGCLILSFRKEYLAEVESLLGEAHLPYKSVFLEHLNHQGIQEAVVGPTKITHYHLSVDPALPSAVADFLLADPGSNVAPTLQVILTKMWKMRDAEHLKTHFSVDAFRTVTREGELLQQFLDEQVEKIGVNVPEATLSGLLFDVLNFHTSPTGHAKLRGLSELEQRYGPARFDQILNLVQHCKDHYLLADPSLSAGREKNRLVHDVLAPIVRQRFDQSDRPGQRAYRILKNRSGEWSGGSKGTALDEVDLATVERGLEGMRSTVKEEDRLLGASRRRRQRNRRVRLALWLFVSIALILGAIQQSQILVQADNIRRDLSDNTARDAVAQFNQQRWMESLHGFARAIEIDSKSLLGMASKSAKRREQEHRILEVSMGDIFLADMIDLGAEISRAQFSPSNKLLAIKKHETIEILDESTATLIPLNLKFPADPNLRFHNLSFSWNSSDRWLSIQPPQGGFLFDTYKNKALELPIDHRIWVMRFSSKEEFLCVVDERRQLIIWNLADAGPDEIFRKDDIINCTFHPDNQRVVTVSNDGTVEMWKLAPAPYLLWSGQGGRGLRGFDLKGGKLLTSTHEFEGIIWSADDGEVLGRFRHGDHFRSEFVGKRQDRILTYSDDGAAAMWNSEDGSLFGEVMQHSLGKPMGASMSPDDQRILTWCSANRSYLWSREGKPLGLRMAHSEPITRAFFSPDGEHIVTLSGDEAHLWSGHNAVHQSRMKHLGIVDNARFVGNDRLITWTRTGRVRLWAIERFTSFGTGSPTRHPATRQITHELIHGGRILGTHYVKKEDGHDRLWTWGENGQIKIWHVPKELMTPRNRAIFDIRKYRWAVSPNGETTIRWQGTQATLLDTSKDEFPSVEFPSNIRRVLISADSSSIAIATDEDGWFVFDPDFSDDPVRIRESGRSEGRFSFDGRRLVTISRSSVKVFDRADGRLIADLGLIENAWEMPLTEHNWLFVKKQKPQPKIILFNLYNGAKIFQIDNKDKKFYDIRLGKNGFFLVRDGSGLTKIWQVKEPSMTTEEICSFPSIRDAWFFQEGNLVGVTDSDHIYIYRLPECQLLVSPIPSPASSRRDFFVDSKSRYLLRKGHCELWSLQTGLRISVLDFPDSQGCKDADFSEDGSQLMTRGDNEIYLWDTTGQYKGVVTRYDQRVTRMAFSPDGHWIASVDYSGNSRIHDSKWLLEFRQFANHGKMNWTRDSNLVFAYGDTIDFRYDEDFPQTHLSLKVEALTGTTLVDQGGVRALSREEWLERRQQYKRIAKEHHSHCSTPLANSFPVQDEIWEKFTPSSRLH